MRSDAVVMRDRRCQLRAYLQPAFLICVAVLGIAGGGMPIATDYLGVVLEKDPCPLKKSLEYLDDKELGPYKVVDKRRIEDQEIVESLGTEEYIQWVFEDTEAPADSAVRKLMLFITYYPLVVDQVPHVPEACYAGGGYQKLGDEGVVFEIDNSETGFRRKIRGTYLLFGRKGTASWAGLDEFPVLYFFRVNEKYAGGREAARRALGWSIFDNCAYFSKVELAFNQCSSAPSREGAVSAAERLLGVILPVLEREHWPAREDMDASE